MRLLLAAATAATAAVFAIPMGLIPASARAPAGDPAWGRMDANCASGPIQRLSHPSALDYAVLASLPDSANLLAVWASSP